MSPATKRSSGRRSIPVQATQPDRAVAPVGPALRAPTGAPIGAHEWVSFPDPFEDRTWVIDVTFLLSPWRCIFGDGCQGVLTGPAPELVQGCCSYGAHFTGDDDVERVTAAAATLTPQDWQHFDRGHGPDGSVDVTVVAEGGETITSEVEGACVFLNGPTFTGGAGCALHRAALARGQRPMDLKPDVCWQLPLRREDETDITGHVTSVLRQWDRRHWGEGGAEFHWWCTEAPEAFSGRAPVHETMRAELAVMVGPAVHSLIEDELARRRAGATTPLPHPALLEPNGRSPSGPASETADGTTADGTRGVGNGAVTSRN